MAAKKSKEPAREAPAASISDLPPGGGTKAVKTRLIGIYGPPKCRKTTSVAYLPMGRTKWLVSDSNCAATLEALDRMPDSTDFYEMKSVEMANEWMKKLLDLVEANGPESLGIDYLIIDSLTQFYEWHATDVAAATGQTYLGQLKGWDSNGYMQFNATFLQFLDLIASVSKYVTVFCIAHSKELHEKQKKGEFGGLNLGGQMSMAFGRKCNWLLLKTLTILPDDGTVKESETITKYTREDGIVEFEEDVLHTKSLVDGYFAVASLKLKNRDRTKWPGDIRVLLRAEGLLDDE